MAEAEAEAEPPPPREYAASTSALATSATAARAAGAVAHHAVAASASRAAPASDAFARLPAPSASAAVPSASRGRRPVGYRRFASAQTAASAKHRSAGRAGKSAFSGLGAGGSHANDAPPASNADSSVAHDGATDARHRARARGPDPAAHANTGTGAPRNGPGAVAGRWGAAAYSGAYVGNFPMAAATSVSAVGATKATRRRERSR